MRTVRVVLWSLGIIVAVTVLLFYWHTRWWPVTGDAALMHYVAFLSLNGRSPYLAITDYNLPLAHLPDLIHIRFFGATDVGWRVYDLLLSGTVVLSMLVFCPRQYRFAAIWSSLTLVAIHARDGVEQSGQRDYLGAALLAAGVACLSKVRGTRVLPFLATFGLLTGTATMVKPVFGIYIVLAWLALRRLPPEQRVKAGLLTLAAFAIPPLLCFGSLLPERRFEALRFCLATLAGFHARLGRLPNARLLYASVSPCIPFFVGALAVVAVKRSKRLPDQNVREAMILALAAAWLGFLCFWVQGKGFPYHRYPLLMFGLFASGLIFVRALHERASAGALSWALLGWGSLCFVPQSIVRATHYDWQHRQLVQQLGGDLNALSGGHPERLNGQIVCIDSVSGCNEALYKLHIVGATRVLYDEFLFRKDNAEAISRSRQMFTQDVSAAPRFVVVTSWLFPEGPQRPHRGQLFSSGWRARTF
jgi:hypothetical protein